MKLERYLYDTSEAGDVWKEKITKIIKIILHLVICLSDEALYFELDIGAKRLNSTLRQFADHVIFLGHKKFHRNISTLRQHLKVSQNSHDIYIQRHVCCKIRSRIYTQSRILLQNI